MNMGTLKIFRDLIDTGSFSKTAELNYISQSAVSQQVKKLELVLKCRLISRLTNKIILTSCGDKFYETSKKIVLLYENSMVSIKQLSASKVAEEIKISTIYSAGIYLVQNYVKKFMVNYPGAKVSVEYRRFSQIHGDIISGRSDFGFMACPCRKLKGVTMSPVAEEEMVIVTSLSDKLAHKKTLAVRELDGLDFIFFDKVFPSRKYVDDFFKKRGVKVNIKMELDNIETIKTAVMSGMGLSMLPLSTIRDDEKAGRLHAARFSDAEVSRPVYLVCNKSRQLPPAAKAFIEIVLKDKHVPGPAVQGQNKP
ncbi:MAG: LysR family transcriptional regulator [Elusimicrobia bacterium]|nr:LysR family transcriptional regulator [Elusimicrobiota bacterium]